MVATSSTRSSPLNYALRTGRLFAVLVTVLGYLVLAPFGQVTLAFLSWLWRRDPRRRARRLQTFTSRAYRFMHWWLSASRILSFEWRRTARQLPDGPCIVIANHPTLVDVTAITAALGGAISIVKPGVYNRAMVKPLLFGLGHVEGPGPDPIRAGKVVDDIVERLAWGIPVIIFPEGTRSPPAGLAPFGRVAFEAARRAAVPLVSLGVRCDPIYLSKDVPPLRPPHPRPHLTVDLLAVDAHDATEPSRALRARAEARYTSWLKRVAADKSIS
ncbi:MAG: lysophospholipid acyltransferase family protein [Planctomycetota bacterium]|nr:lysophospholipid acyltransferase family protein [Planctomycetota bacterium]